MKTGTSLPPVCASGELFFHLSAPAGQNLFGCTATNTWTVMSSGGSGGGSGSGYFCSDAGTENAYACNLSGISAYASGLLIYFQAATSNTGAATFDVNGLGARPLKKAKDQELTANEIRAGQWVEVVYDGESFQMQSQPGVFLEAGPTLALKLDRSVFPYTIDIDTNLVCTKTGTCGHTGAFDLSGSVKTSPVRIGSTDPATCDAAVREFFYNTTANALKVCNAENTWTAVGGGGAPAASATDWLFPLDIPPSSSNGTLTNVTANKLYCYMLSPRMNYTLQRAAFYMNSLPSSKAIAAGIYTSSGARLTNASGRVVGPKSNFEVAEIQFAGNVNLTAGTSYYFCWANEDSTSALYINAAGGSTGVQSLYNVNNAKRVAEAVETATGSGSSYTLPASLTLTGTTNPVAIPSILLAQ